jgi:hypothetical protein
MSSAPFGSRPPRLELLRVFQEVDDLLELLLRLITPGHVGERDLGRVAREQLGFRLAERERAISPLLHLPHHEEDEAEHQEVRQEIDEDHAERGPQVLGVHVDALGAQRRHPRLARLERQQRREVLGFLVVHEDRVTEVALDPLPLGDLDPLHVLRIDLLDEIGIGDFGGILPRAGGQLHQQHGPHDEKRPE